MKSSRKSPFTYIAHWYSLQANCLMFISAFALFLAFTVSTASAEKEIALWGGTLSRNMVSDEKNIPENWDMETGENIKWAAELGSQSYAGPLVIGGKVFVGTNNKALRNPKLTGDRGVIMAFRESDGKFLWHQPTRSSLQAELTTGPCKEFVPPRILKATASTISPTVVKSSVLTLRVSLMVKTTVPLPKKPKQARLTETSSGATI